MNPESPGGTSSRYTAASHASSAWSPDRSSPSSPRQSDKVRHRLRRFLGEQLARDTAHPRVEHRRRAGRLRAHLRLRARRVGQILACRGARRGTRCRRSRSWRSGLLRDTGLNNGEQKQQNGGKTDRRFHANSQEDRLPRRALLRKLRPRIVQSPKDPILPNFFRKMVPVHIRF